MHTIYPFEESFSISDYRQAVSKVRKIRIKATRLAHEIVDVLEAAGSEEIAEEPTAAQIEHHRSSSGFQ